MTSKTNKFVTRLKKLYKTIFIPVILPLLLVFLGAFAAFRFDEYLNEKEQKESLISYINVSVEEMNYEQQRIGLLENVVKDEDENNAMQFLNLNYSGSIVGLNNLISYGPFWKYGFPKGLLATHVAVTEMEKVKSEINNKEYSVDYRLKALDLYNDQLQDLKHILNIHKSFISKQTSLSRANEQLKECYNFTGDTLLIRKPLEVQ